jgi:hypothetical protein
MSCDSCYEKTWNFGSNEDKRIIFSIKEKRNVFGAIGFL